MKVLFLAAELAPLVKVGGLADVTGSLPKALGANGVQVRALMPYYRGALAGVATTEVGTIRIWGGEYRLHLTQTTGFPVYLLEADAYYDRAGIYGEGGEGYQDNDKRYGFLGAAALEFGAATGWVPDLIHLHDWHTAAAAVHARRRGGPPTVLTIHNLAYQGVFPRESLGALGLPEDLFTPACLEFYGQVNLLKGGMVSTDLVTTVSPNYAREICTPAFGEGLEGVLNSLPHPPEGILNGLDLAIWNSQTDPAIGSIDPADPLPGKEANKEELCRQLGLEPPGLLAGMVTRLASQKGVDLVLASLPQMLEMGLSLAVLGDGDPALAAGLEEAARSNPKRVAVQRGFNDGLARRIYAGSDLFFVPSRFEPCGLTQMIAMRYGAVPVVRHTGGLADTVHEGVDGFVFSSVDVADLLAATGRAMEALGGGGRQGFVNRVLARDFSWDASAKRYLELYQKVREG